MMDFIATSIQRGSRTMRFFVGDLIQEISYRVTGQWLTRERKSSVWFFGLAFLSR